MHYSKPQVEGFIEQVNEHGRLAKNINQNGSFRTLPENKEITISENDNKSFVCAFREPIIRTEDIIFSCSLIEELNPNQEFDSSNSFDENFCNSDTHKAILKKIGKNVKASILRLIKQGGINMGFQNNF